MWRIVGGVLLTTGLAGAAGCGAKASSSTPSAAGLSAAVLSGSEVPAGFLPAENQRVFEGMRPVDRDCARLLALADVETPRDIPGVEDENVPQASAAFYRPGPAASLVEHVFRLPPGRAARHVAETRRAALRCPRIEIRLTQGDLRLPRVNSRKVRALRDALALRYARERAGLDVVMAAVGNDLLVVAGAGTYGGRVGPRVTEQVAIKALRKLRAVHAGKIHVP
ncbi:hypothetical protein SMC26_12550 [Actinomadura fulvescens]|uniref:Lipoprotein n=1 Tax=Actinomadura fulvescens TaxID=46160 RepID=A0ABN3PD65_9ACTN